MVNPILIVTACIFAVLVMVTALYFLIYYQHPDDKLVAWFPKIVVVR
jgi:LMBR1 domain-containing protein 1